MLIEPLKWTPNGPQMDPKWTPNGPQMDPKWTQNGPKMDPHGDTHINAFGAWHTYKRGSPRSEHLKVAPSWQRSSRLRKRPIAIDENVGWIHFLSRDVHKCNRLFLDSNTERILGIALLEFSRIDWNSFALSMSWIIFFDFSLNGMQALLCWKSAWECLSMRSGSRSSSGVREHEIVCLFHNCMWQSRHCEVDVCFLALCEQNGWIDLFQRVSRFWFDLRLRFCLRLYLDLNVQQTLTHNWKSPCSFICAFAAK